MLERFLKRLSYVALDATKPATFPRLAQAIGDPERGLAIFLSTAPSLFEPTIAGLEAAGLARPAVRMALEKPLGSDLNSSREINDAVAAAFPEKSARSGSTIIWARRRSRICWRCASPI